MCPKYEILRGDEVQLDYAIYESESCWNIRFLRDSMESSGTS